MVKSNGVTSSTRYLTFSICLMLAFVFTIDSTADAKMSSKSPETAVPKFPLQKSGLELSRDTRSGTFFDVIGRRAAVFGYEHRGFEIWSYPMKLVDYFRP